MIPGPATVSRDPWPTCRPISGRIVGQPDPREDQGSSRSVRKRARQDRWSIGGASVARSRQGGRGAGFHCPRSSVLVCAEDVQGRAGVADRQAGVQVAQGDRHLAVRVEALDLVQPLRRPVQRDQAPIRAALDPVGREMRLVGLSAVQRCRFGEGKRHGKWLDLSGRWGCAGGWGRGNCTVAAKRSASTDAQPSTRDSGAARVRRY